MTEDVNPDEPTKDLIADLSDRQILLELRRTMGELVERVTAFARDRVVWAVGGGRGAHGAAPCHALCAVRWAWRPSAMQALRLGLVGRCVIRRYRRCLLKNASVRSQASLADASS